ncbi:GH92 family glycosyl hydrolase [Mucilaginibacter sp. SG564]|uniref:GH92 family glycosyl hydrolase n=1 Tax=Mucilaginibacter sp. SG564 TaxID=2587022 RepID=UPI001555461D|nr:GH92 family glycosyl hydrolase [Mucilaginibacter sp. SG564]NOW96042.1 putative alpha-1,2-mannosidase [Mucilaginibacter sp. SG564]
MNHFYKLAFFSLSLFSSSIIYAQSPKLYGKYVNPFIGTGAVKGGLSGNNYPGATVPFGMVQLSPDTKDEPDWEAGSGYNYNDDFIAGFSHTHLSGTGAPDLFDILLMPYNGGEKTRAGNPDQPGSGYGSHFSHASESASPGYYKVKLDDHNIQAELTATEHAGFHRYTFSSGHDAKLVIDLNHSMKKGVFGCHVIAAQFKILDNRTIEGFRVITGWASLRKVYFFMQFNKPIIKSDLIDGGNQYFDTSVLNGTDLRAVLDFDDDKPNPLLVKVGLSTVSTTNAKTNLLEEIPAWDFEKTVEQAADSWERQLNKIKVEGSPEQMQIFYTAMYHTLVQPNNYADWNGEYTAINNSIGLNRNGFYSTFSLWDTYRAAHPLYTLVQPGRDAAFVNSMISQYEKFGYLPIWQLWGQENYCMIGNHAIPVIADAALKSIPGVDVNRAYEAIKNSSVLSHPGSPFDIWDRYHYIPEDKQTQSVSITLEMAYDDWCVAQLARKLNKPEDYNYFLRRSQNYRNLFDAQTKFFRGKNSDGQWLSPFEPLRYGGNGGYPYTEGNAWQYNWYVPQDIRDLIDLIGGEKAFVARLDRFFSLENPSGQLNNNASGFIGQYAHGNEPSHHIIYLYDFAGQPWRTQYYNAKVCSELYNTSSSGYAGNEDCGQMSAWYIFSAMGFYPVNPTGQVYAIGSPVLKSARIELSNNKNFQVITKNYAQQNIYIQSAKLNGKKYSHAYLTYSDILKGGVIEFDMGPRPNKTWGAQVADRPPNQHL